LAGHLVRMSDDRTVETVFLGKPDRTRKAGRPKLRWLYCTENDLKSIGVERRRRRTEDRLACTIILKAALFTL